MERTLEPGTVLWGHYRIERKLGAGGMGAVYAARNIHTMGDVALKILTHDSDFAVENFQFEATVGARIRKASGPNRNIVEVKDAGYRPGEKCRYIVMELLEGQSFAERVKPESPLSAPEVVDFVEQIARGLDAAHSCAEGDKPTPIVHRDIKPANLFLTTGSVVKILDFGLAKRVSASVATSGEARGTPLYMAPEQFMGAKVCPATDVWALGLVTFFLLTGHEFWNSARVTDATTLAVWEELQKSRASPSARFRELTGSDPTWTPAFDAWFARATEKMAHSRFPTAGAAAAALRKALLGKGREPRAMTPSVDPLGATETSPRLSAPVDRSVGAAKTDGPLTQSVVSFSRFTDKLGSSRVGWGLAVAVTAGLLFVLKLQTRRADVASPSPMISNDSPARGTAAQAAVEANPPSPAPPLASAVVERPSPPVAQHGSRTTRANVALSRSEPPPVAHSVAPPTESVEREPSVPPPTPSASVSLASASAPPASASVAPKTKPHENPLDKR